MAREDRTCPLRTSGNETRKCEREQCGFWFCDSPADTGRCAIVAIAHTLTTIKDRLQR